MCVCACACDLFCSGDRVFGAGGQAVGREDRGGRPPGDFRDLLALQGRVAPGEEGRGRVEEDRGREGREREETAQAALKSIARSMYRLKEERIFCRLQRWLDRV